MATNRIELQAGQTTAVAIPLVDTGGINYDAGAENLVRVRLTAGGVSVDSAGGDLLTWAGSTLQLSAATLAYPVGDLVAVLEIWDDANPGGRLLYSAQSGELLVLAVAAPDEDEAATGRSYALQLLDVQKAIREVLELGQSVREDGRTFVRADLDSLEKREQSLRRIVASESRRSRGRRSRVRYVVT